MTKVLAAALSWNQKEKLFGCLDSLRRLEYPDYEVAVVDNDSRDGTFEALRERYPQVQVVRHRENFGYGEGVNGQIRLAIERGVDFLLSLHNDVRVEPDTLSKLVQPAESDPKIGVVFPEVKCLRGDGQNKGTGAIFLVRMEAVKKAGFLNPDYFIYDDDADWFQRIRQAGYTLHHVSGAKAQHESASALGFDSKARHYYQTRNRLFFHKTHSHPVPFVFFLISFFAGCVCWKLPGLLVQGRAAAAGGVALGLLDFLRGKKRNREFSVEKGRAARLVFWKFRRSMAAFLRKISLPVKRALKRPLRIQVFVNWNIGDEMFAAPAYEALKKRYPGCLIDAEVKFPELLEGNPFVDFLNHGEKFGADLLIDLHRDIRPRRRWEYLPELCGVKTWGAPKIYLGTNELEEARRKWGLEGPGLCIVACPEVWWFSRRWPRENWIRCLEHFRDKYEARIFILGTEDDSFPVGMNLVRKTSLREAASLIRQCHLFLAHDSGPLYVGVSVGTPSVGLFGPLNPDLLYPPQPHFIPVWSGVECRGCWPDLRMKFRDHCPKMVPDCMTTIPVSRVIEAGERLLSTGSCEARP